MLPQKLINKVLQIYWRQSRGLTLGAQGIVLDDANRVLLVQHTYRPGWHFPGGGVEKGETVVEALHRELREEAGVEITGPPELIGVYANHVIFPNDHVVLFLVRAWRQPTIPKPNVEIGGQAMFPLDALPENISAPTRARIEEFQGTRPRSPHWWTP